MLQSRILRSFGRWCSSSDGYSAARTCQSFFRGTSSPCSRSSYLNRWAICAISNEAKKSVDPKADSILRFWLGDEYQNAPLNDTAASKRVIWFQGSAETDRECVERFSSVMADADQGKLTWGSGYEGLAAVILMDQLSRNIFRHKAKMYELDAKALDLAKQIHDGGSTAGFPAIHRVWLYMTHMHSESLEDQELGLNRFKELLEEAKGLPDSQELQDSLKGNISFGEAHLKVIQKWGRFPHRNKILGRSDTPEEQQGFQDGSIPSF